MAKDAGLCRTVIIQGGEAIAVTSFPMLENSEFLRRIFVPGSVEIVPEGCFDHYEYPSDLLFCEASRLIIISRCSFYWTSLRAVAIPASVEIIGDHCFYQCASLTEVTFVGDSQLQKIENDAFRDTNLRRISIPWRVETIGRSCFQGCSSLRKVSFTPRARLRLIDRDAFCGAWRIRSLRVPFQAEIVDCNDGIEVRRYDAT
jgi:hypothetical protein